MGNGAVQSGYRIPRNETGLGAKKRNGVSEGKQECFPKDKTAECMAFLREKSEEILEKLRNGETEISYQIGGESYTEKEWDKLLKKFDDIQEDVRRKMEDLMEMRAEEEE